MTGRPSLPAYDGARVVVAAPGTGPGSWAGAASAVLVDGTYWLAYRLRRPLADGRGVAVVVARSDDGEEFTPVAELHRDTFGAESRRTGTAASRRPGVRRAPVAPATPPRTCRGAARRPG